ncbi:MAG: hypothetical protein EPO24_10875 [Bacteroidetes bacterium]|nr:MAG: hypothetical protein EPO24_10875 [Bacteroidota bacterium]
MKNILTFLLITIILFPLLQSTAFAGGDNAIIPLMTNKDATVNAADTMKVIKLDEYDWFGIYISANDTLEADVYVEYTASGTNKYAQYVDSVIVTNSAGGLKCITLRSPKVENIPFGADQMRVIIARRDYAQVSVGKFSFGIQPYPYKRYKSRN